ncbi:unnamed protein product [Closterium sp. NIES-54]
MSPANGASTRTSQKSVLTGPDDQHLFCPYHQTQDLFQRLLPQTYQHFHRLHLLHPLHPLRASDHPCDVAVHQRQQLLQALLGQQAEQQQPTQRWRRGRMGRIPQTWGEALF